LTDEIRKTIGKKDPRVNAECRKLFEKIILRLFTKMDIERRQKYDSVVKRGG